MKARKRILPNGEAVSLNVTGYNIETRSRAAKVRVELKRAKIARGKFHDAVLNMTRLLN